VKPPWKNWVARLMNQTLLPLEEDGSQGFSSWLYSVVPKIGILAKVVPNIIKWVRLFVHWKWRSLLLVFGFLTKGIYSWIVVQSVCLGEQERIGLLSLPLCWHNSSLLKSKNLLSHIFNGHSSRS
jgi:uncharacterized membrane protein YdbT with pleckstrin-like domain